MKKLVNTGLSGPSILRRVTWVALFLAGFGQIHGQGCVMSCPPMVPPVQVSLPSSCSDVLTYDEIGVVLENCPGPITLNILDNGVPIGNVINASMIGNTYMVVVSHPSSGQSCMTAIQVVDKQAPLIDCPNDITLACTADLSEYEGLLPENVSDCSGTTISIDDQLLFSGMCQGPFVSQFKRTYTVQDDYQNVSTCTQIISKTKVSLGNVEFPPNLTGPDALSCAPSPDTSPENTGYPSVGGNDIQSGNFCNLYAGFSDITVNICSGSYKIIRTWTVVDWCDSSASTAGTQWIEVLDKTPPVVSAPLDVTISTVSTSCTANVLLPPADIDEDCSLIQTVWMNTPMGTIQSNGGMISGLPVGVHKIVYYALSDCSLIGKDSLYITVQDLSPPVPVCQSNLTIPVSIDGTAIIPAYIFNSASYDNCGSVYFKVRRMSPPVGYSCANPGNPNNLFDDFIQFCCGDIANSPLMVVLRVYDLPPVPGPVSDAYLTGHFNDCMVQVTIQDKLPPQIICPSNLTISCLFPFTLGNLDVFGTVALSEGAREPICLDDPGDGLPGLQCTGQDGLAVDNCNVQVTSEAALNVNMCGVGTLLRTFTATDDGGLTATCVQTITIKNFDPFDLSQITWPEDYTTTQICDIGLLDPEDLDPPYNEPVLADGPCDLVGATYDDDVFDFSNHDQACFKILRTWKVIDWCQYSTNNAYGIWQHIQVIKVMNSVAPEISGVEDRSVCSYDPACGGLEMDFSAVAEDDCSGPASLTWRYFIDLSNNQSFDYTSPLISGDSISFSRYMPIGTHRILYSVWDQCGNSTTAEQEITVTSCKPPSAKCIQGLSTNLMAMDTDGDNVPDWGMVVLQASMFDAGSDHPCGNPVTVAFSADPLDVTRVYDCTDFGINEVELWAIDQNGLTDFCLTTVDIQDNNGICPPGLGGGTGIISGNINVPNAGKLPGAMVYLDGSNLSGAPTSADGYFVFPPMPFGGAYTVRPVKDGDPRNGVTTIDLVKIQKHLLGLEFFNSPYQYIAADANNSASVTAIDIVQLRKLILGFYDELPNNHSWRFVDHGYLFPDPNNPWVSSWPETYTIHPFSNTVNDADFDAIKVGDLNLSASLQLNGTPIVNRNGEHATVEYEVHPQPEQDILRVDLYLADAAAYEAIQFSFDWDQRGYELKDWRPAGTLTADDVRMPRQPGEAASLSTFTTGNWPQGRLPLLTMWVERKSSLTYPFQVFLKPKPTTALAYSLQPAQEIAVQIVGRTIEGAVMQNRPNPFQDMTTILFTSDRAEAATLRIYDLNGSLVHARELQLMSGENECIIHKSDLRHAGVYLYEIESSHQYSTNRMIIVE